MAKFIINYSEEDSLEILLEIIKQKVEEGYTSGMEGRATWEIKED